MICIQILIYKINKSDECSLPWNSFLLFNFIHLRFLYLNFFIFLQNDVFKAKIAKQSYVLNELNTNIQLSIRSPENDQVI